MSATVGVSLEKRRATKREKKTTTFVERPAGSTGRITTKQILNQSGESELLLPPTGSA